MKGVGDRRPLFLGGLKSYIPEDLSWSLFTHSTVGHIPGLAKNLFNDIRWREARPQVSLFGREGYVQGTE